MNAAATMHRDEPRPRGTLAPELYQKGALRLVRAVQELSMARDLLTIQIIVRRAARELTNCDGATFVLRDNGFCYYADEDAVAPLWKGKRFPMEICISGWVMLNGKPAVISDIYEDERIPHDAYKPTFVKSLVMVPIRSMNPIGAIGNYWASPHEPSEEEIELLQSLADSTAIAMENVQIFHELEARVQKRTAELQRAKREIEQISVTDELTGLSNRRGFHLQAAQALAWNTRRKEACALAFIDIDGLKNINDNRGHDVGDAMIAEMATVLRATCRESDVIARLGGDEFCVLLLNTVADSDSFSRRLQESIRQLNQAGNRPYQLSASVGIAHKSADASLSLDEMLQRADSAMYMQKHAKMKSESTAG